MNAVCSGELVEIITQSQQKVSSLSNKRMSPTFTSAEVTSSHLPALRHFTFVLLTFLSEVFLTQSSIPSLIMEIARTAARGTIAVMGVKGESGSDCSIAIIRK